MTQSLRMSGDSVWKVNFSSLPDRLRTTSCKQQESIQAISSSFCCNCCWMRVKALLVEIRSKFFITQTRQGYSSRDKYGTDLCRFNYLVLTVQGIHERVDACNDFVIVHELVHLLAQVIHSADSFRRSDIGARRE